jgi:hypothetical protein
MFPGLVDDRRSAQPFRERLRFAAMKAADAIDALAAAFEEDRS